ncbi:hypothetical protein MD484_g2704, partial [Candolleomyces efflorescens]
MAARQFTSRNRTTVAQATGFSLSPQAPNKAEGETMPSSDSDEEDRDRDKSTMNPGGGRGEESSGFTTPIRKYRSVDDLKSARTPITERNIVFNLAYKNLTRAQKEKIEKRKEALKRQRSRSPSRGEGPSKRVMEKATDPRNWGQVDLSDSELEAQKAMYESLAAAKERIRKSERKVDLNEDSAEESEISSDDGVSRKGKRHRSLSRKKRHSEERRDKWKKKNYKARKEEKENKKRDRKRKEKSDNRAPSEEIRGLIQDAVGKARKPARADGVGITDDRDFAKLGLKPTEQIEKNNYINDAFARVKKAEKRSHKGKPSDSEDDSSSSDSSSNDGDDGGSISSDPSDSDDSSEPSSDSDGSDSGSESGRSRRGRSRRTKRFKKKVSKSNGKYKPIPPEEYDGRANLPALHRFMTEAAMWIEDCEIPRNRQVLRLSRFLKGEAYRFYARHVAREVEQWRMDKFFFALYDHCFPVDFKERQQSKLERFEQRKLTVREYLSQLEEMFLATGTSSEREKRRYFFRGLRNEIQVKLREVGILPETSKFKEMLRKAERAELAIKLSEADRERHNKDRSGNGKSKNGNSDKGKRPEGQKYSGKTEDRHTGSYRKDRSYGGNHFGRKTNGRPSNSTDQASGSSSGFHNHQNRQKHDKNRPKLTDEEKEDLRAQGKCYICKESGHMARSCPKANSFSGSRRPGLRNYNINVQGISESEIQDAEDKRNLAEATETIHSLSVCMMSHEFDQSDEASSPNEIDDELTYHFVSESNNRLNDPVLSRIQHLLPAAVPFPSDDLGTAFEWDRFEVYRCIDGYCIMDTQVDEDIFIPFGLAFNPHFDIIDWYRRHLEKLKRIRLGRVEIESFRRANSYDRKIGDQLGRAVEERLNKHFQQSDEFLKLSDSLSEGCDRFCVTFDQKGKKHFIIEDFGLKFNAFVPIERLVPNCDVVGLYKKYLVRSYRLLDDVIAELPENEDSLWLLNHEPSAVEIESRDELKELEMDWSIRQRFRFDEIDGLLILKSVDGVELPLGTFPGIPVVEEPEYLELCSQFIEPSTYAALERNTTARRDASRQVPEPVVIVVSVNGNPVRALVDTGSLGDFMSTSLADQLKVKKIELVRPINIQLACQGSRTKSKYGAKVNFKYQKINEDRWFDIVNLQSYDLILGTPFLYQHQVSVGLNPPRLVIGSDSSLPISGKNVRTLSSQAMTTYQEKLDGIRSKLMSYARVICKSALDTELPPLRAINHRIPLIDPEKRYHWRPSKCPEPLLGQWAEKRAAYVKSKRWVPATAFNSVPMLCIPKPGKPGEPPKLRTVVDLRERNANTKKMTCPLPDMEGILRRVARAKYRTIMDGKDAYEQIRIHPDDVKYSAMTTPDGPMFSNVLQQGDCNAVATFQTIMTSIFSPWIGKWIDVYLDDIIIYSDSLDDHIRHFKTVVDVLRREMFYLNESKIHILPKEMKILGRIIDDDGIRMDPDKVESLVNWKTPTSRELLRGFLGAASYLADDIAGVRIPMGILFNLTSNSVPFRWEFTHQRAFEEVKRLASICRNHSRVPLKYGSDSPPINVVTDACATGVAGVVSQGDDWKNAKVAAFFSAKLNKAQQNYPVHELEMLAGVETMMRHRDILQGTRFRWFTDHKGLVFLLKQKDLSGRQARWMEKLMMFDFEIVYVPGAENVLSDALSRIYSNDAPGTVRSVSEYTEFDDIDNSRLGGQKVSMPLLVGKEGVMSIIPQSEQRPVDLQLSAMTRSKARINPEPQVSSPRRSARVAAAAAKSQPPEAPKRKERQKKATEGVSDATVHGGGLPGDNFVPGGSMSPGERREGARTETDTQNESEPLISEEANKDDSPDVVERSEVPPDLVEIVRESKEGLDLPKLLKGKFSSDPFFQIILDNPRHYKNFLVEDEIVYLKSSEGKRLLCIPKTLWNGRSIREIVINEAHSLLAHLGYRKTITYLRDHVWWKDLVTDVEKFCKTCVVCMQHKSSNQRPYGLLNPLNLPTQPWESIGIDFVGPLPTSENRDGKFDMLTVIIDRLTGMVRLVPSREDYTSKNMAELVFSEVYKLHGLPKSIVSDRDKLFTATFWSHLHRLIGTRLRMSSAYHPETDGVTERANKTVVQMIRQCIGNKQKDWVIKLPAVEFAINTARSETTGFAPFFLNYGRLPRSFIWDAPESDEFPGVRTFATKIKNAIMSAHDSIIEARVKQTRNANLRRQVSPFTIGDLVYVSSQNIRFDKGLTRKFLPKFIGPYRVIDDFRNNSYRLDLPRRMTSRGIHDVFHASLLRVHHRNDDQLFPGRIDNQIWEYPNEGREKEFAIEKIVSHTGTGEHTLVQILWKDGVKSWLPYHKIDHLPVFTEYLDAMGVKNVTELGSLNSTSAEIDEQVELGELSADLSADEIFIELATIEFEHQSIMSYQTSHSQPFYSSQHSPYNPILDNYIENLRHLGGDRFSLTYRDSDGQVKAAVYFGRQIAPFIEIADMIHVQHQQRLPIAVEVIGGYHEFSTRWNSISGFYKFPIQKHDGSWDLPDRWVSSQIIDVAQLAAQAPNEALEAIGATSNGVANVGNIRTMFERQNRLLDSQATLMANVGGLLNSTRSRHHPIPFQYRRGRGRGHGPTNPHFRTPADDAVAAGHRVSPDQLDTDTIDLNNLPPLPETPAQDSQDLPEVAVIAQDVEMTDNANTHANSV